MQTTIDTIREHFPHEHFREGQQECIEHILNAFNNGKRFFILEAPTGSGKSAIGITVARHFARSYYLTIQRFLQTQIVNDFSDGQTIVDLKGRTNYPCTYYENFGQRQVDLGLMKANDLKKQLAKKHNCNEGFCRKRRKQYKCDLCFPAPSDVNAPHSLCPYYERVYQTQKAQIALMNFSSFLYQTTMTNRFDKRNLMIVDETHNLEPQLLDFISVSFDDKQLSTYGFELPELELPEEYAVYFIENELLELSAQLLRHCVDYEDIQGQDYWASLIRKIRNFLRCMENNEEWVAEYKQSPGYATITLKPIFVRDKAYNHIFNMADHVLMMSATILNVGVFSGSLGIPKANTESFRMRNRFPAENRPIYMRSAGKITGGKKNMPQWGPKLVAKADEVIAEYPDVRGIIHTHNFQIAELLLNKSKHKKRFLFQKRFRTKELMLEEHARCDNSLIVAPAMHEGLDLVEGLSRLQIICKVPWPNFIDDKQLARRIEIDRRFYDWLTALKLVQSYGRSVRSEDDWADTYVLDEVFLRFIDAASAMIPPWFRDALRLDKTTISTTKRC